MQSRRKRRYSEAAETIVAEIARTQGWTIICRNFRRPGCEIDIIMLKQSCLVAVEVKFRRGVVDLDTLISNRKKAALTRGIEKFLALDLYQPDVIRFDLAVVSPVKGKLTLIHYCPDFFQT